MEIKKAYRALAKKYHPDKSTAASAAQLFSEVNEAYEVLSDPEQKLVYDQSRNGTREAQAQPAYRPRRQYSRPSQQQIDVTPYVPYFRMASYVALALSLVLSIDFLLPRDIQQERVINIQRIMGKSRGGGTYLFAVEVITDNGIFRLGPNSEVYFGRNQSLDIHRTLLLNKATSVRFSDSDSLDTHSLKSSIYGNFSFSLVVLLITSVVGSWLKKPPMTVLNFGIVNGALLMLVLYFTSIS